MELQGVTALVTGAGRRVGRAIALGLAGAGANLVVHYNRSADEAEEVAGEIRSLGVEATTVGGDLGGEAAAVMAGAGPLAPVRVLVNSAASFPDDTLMDVDRDGWDRTLAVNLTGPVFLTQAFAAALPSDAEGAVVNITDWRTSRPYRDHFSYTVAKGALDTFTLAAAEALAPRIRVNAVALGAILPPPGRDSAYLRELAREIPVQRVGGTEPVVAAVLALLANDFITGEILRVDGGAHLR
ncbi:MAG: SDR family oxidoreductase [Acidimicrobiia bacterium]|nr:MAG: SDR family oxidoreductase [Acidimicrobiia bacterium]